MPFQSERVDDVQIGAWIHMQRQMYKKGTLSAERIALLDRIPEWMWRVNDTPENAWNTAYTILCRFVETNARLPTRRECVDGVQIGSWIDTQRQTYKKGKLSADRIALLERVPQWKWRVKK